MDQQSNQLFELFKFLLNNLNLPEDIFGYSACLILLTILIFVKSVVLSCMVRKLKSCTINQAQFDICDLEIVQTMQILEYLVIISGLFFSLTFFWLLSVTGALDCMRSSSIKSASHCLSLVIAQSEQILAESRTRLRQRNQNNPTQALPQATSGSNQLVPYRV